MSLRAYDMMVERFFPHVGGGGGGDTSSTMYTNMIPTYIPGFQEWTEEYLAEALALSTAPNYQEYTGDTYAAQDANETDGIAAVATRGRFGSQVELDGKAFLRDLYDGNKENTNTKIDAYYTALVEELLEEFDWVTLPTIRNSFAFAFGGSEHNVAEAKAAAAMMKQLCKIGKMYYDDYAKERARREEGLQHATPYGLQCIRDMEMLRQAGVYAREYDQGGLTDDWEKWNEAQILPMRNLDILGNAVRTILSTYRQTTTKFYKPPVWAQIAGVALSGLSLWSMFSGTSLSPYANAKIGAADLSNSKAALNTGLNPGGSFFS